MLSASKKMNCQPKTTGKYPGRQKDGKPLCAGSKKDGKPCGNYALDGKAVCYIHGGNTPSGIASPAFKTGRYSKHLHSRLAAKFDEGMQCADPVGVSDQYWLLDALLRDKLEQLDEVTSASMWKAAQAKFRDLRSAINRQHTSDVRRCLTELEGILNNGLGQSSVEQDIRSIAMEQAVLVKVETQRLTAGESAIDAKDVLALHAALLHAFMEVLSWLKEQHPDIDERKTRFRISEVFARTVNRSNATSLN